MGRTPPAPPPASGGARRWALVPLLAAVLATAGPPRPAGATVAAGALAVRAEGRAPVVAGRVDAAAQRALDEALRRAVLEALRGIAPERQSPQDLETWQETVLPRAIDFVAAWRVLAAEERDGFYQLEAEVEVWREKLARAARRTGGTAPAPALRVLVLADSLPLADPASDEEVDAGRHVAAALEAELARRGAVVVSTTERAPWEGPSGPPSEENRVALAAAAARRLEADAVLTVRLTRGAGLVLQAQLIAVSSESTLGAARGEVALAPQSSLADAVAPAARQIAAALAPRLSGARGARGRATLP